MYCVFPWMTRHVKVGHNKTLRTVWIAHSPSSDSQILLRASVIFPSFYQSGKFAKKKIRSILSLDKIPSHAIAFPALTIYSCRSLGNVNCSGDNYVSYPVTPTACSVSNTHLY